MLNTFIQPNHVLVESTLTVICAEPCHAGANQLAPASTQQSSRRFFHGDVSEFSASAGTCPLQTPSATSTFGSWRLPTSGTPCTEPEPNHPRAYASMAKCVKRYPGRRWANRAFHFLDRSGRGGCAGTARAGARIARRSPNPTELVSRPDFETGRSAGMDPDRPPGSSHPLPHSRAPPSAAPPFESPSALGTPADRPLPEPPFPRAQRPSSCSSIERPCSTPGASTPSQGRFHPGPPHTAAASRRSPCVAATPRGAFDFAKRLECASCRRCRRATAPGDLLPALSSGPVLDPSLFVAHSTAFSLRRPASTRLRGGCTRTSGLGLKAPTLRLPSSLPPPGAAQVAGGKQKTGTRP